MTIDSSEADPLEIIKVVSEFLDMFPKDLQVCHLSRNLSLTYSFFLEPPPSLKEPIEYMDQSWLNLRSISMSCQRKVTLG
jgi:hypothetical protein